ncbi:MAG TPA: hypothetical protein VG738_16485 [Chitinophagaceae bacterium]|nr:hypothetical protein [Chitinophagaceae bacterium]
MAILIDRTPLICPSDNLIVTKYFDLAKFLSLLSKRALFFCRLDKLEDKYEGVTAEKNYLTRVNWYEQIKHFSQTPLTKEQIETKVAQHYEFEKKVREVNCISCWNKDSRETAALWKIYSDFGKGIMIKSSIGRIKDAMKETVEDVRIGEVKYINYTKDVMPDGNTFYPIVHKRDFFSYENEVRLIHQVDYPQIGRYYNWDAEPNEKGKLIKADLDLLIDEIIVGPFSQKWTTELIKDIIGKFGIEKTVNRSTI